MNLCFSKPMEVCSTMEYTSYTRMYIAMYIVNSHVVELLLSNPHTCYRDAAYYAVVMAMGTPFLNLHSNTLMLLYY